MEEPSVVGVFREHRNTLNRTGRPSCNIARLPKGRIISTVTMTAILVLFSFLPVDASSSPSHVSANKLMVLRMSDEGGNAMPSLEPPMAFDVMVLGLIFGGLVTLDQNLHVIPDDADSWQISKDGRVYTFHIRPNLKLGDGTPVTADDFAWSLNRAFSPQFASGPAGYYLGSIQGSTDVINKKASWASGLKVLHTTACNDCLQITLTAPSSVFLQRLAYPTSYLVPRALIQRWGSQWVNRAVGTGPFIIKGWRAKQELILMPNPYYWRGHLALHELDLELADADHAYAMYRANSIDVMGAIAFPNAYLLQASSLPGYFPQHLLLTDYLVPNVTQKPFDNVKVRQAFANTINRDALAHNQLGDVAYPASGILPPGLPGFNGQLHGQHYDPALGRKLLAEAGYPGGKGLPPITLLVDSSGPMDAKEATALQANWKATLGVTITLQLVSDHGSYNDMLTAHHFQLAFSTWAADYPDPQNALSVQLQTNTSNNVGRYSNGTFDRLTKQADTMEIDSAAALFAVSTS